MNDKDKEAFEKWLKDDFDEKCHIHFMEFTWKAACEYKQKEINELEESLATRLAKSYVAGKDLSKIIQKNLTNEVEKLQAENAKLRECVKEIANEDYRGNRSNNSVKAYLCLKELEDK